jgi:CO/xanthine dehydrogenase Mo-binding subunit
MAAVANAIASATGVRFCHLPISPGVVLDALGEKAGNPAG